MTLRTGKEQGEFIGVEEGGGSILYEGSRRSLDPFSVDEKAGVDIDLALEVVVAELGGVDGWHNAGWEGRRKFGRMRGTDEWVCYIYPTGAPASRSGGVGERVCR